MRKEVLISGHGGQGVVLAGQILAKAFFTEGYEVIHTQSYGSEARGGASRSEIVASDGYIYDLTVTQPEFVVFMSIQAYTKHIDRVKAGGFVIIDADVMKEIEKRGGKARQDIKIHKVPARRMASEMGNPIVANMILLGFLARRLDIVTLDIAQSAVGSETSAQMRDINVTALEAGWKMATSNRI